VNRKVKITETRVKTGFATRHVVKTTTTVSVAYDGTLTVHDRKSTVIIRERTWR
jgi:hypothetical protein